MARRPGAFVWVAVCAALLLPALAGAQTDVFISEYIEGSSNNKAIEIYNPTASAIDLSAGSYVLQMYFNGSASSGLNITLTGTVAAGDVYVVAHSSASATILAQADQTNGSGWFNGDDAVVLRKGGTGGTVVDSIGQVGVDPGTEWGTGLTSTADNTLRRKSTVCAGDTNTGDAFDPATEWDGYAIDTFGGLGSHTATCGSGISLSINDVSQAEGNSGTTTFSFTVSLSAPAGAGGVTFDIATADNTATTADGDYVARSLTGQTIAQGNSSYSFDVTVNGDTAVESNETFFVNVTNVVGATVSDGQGQGTITNDDVVLTPIHDIQGNGATSPIVGSVVTTTGIVTARKFNNGYFIQEPDASVDADPATSEGIFVFTSSAPPAAAAVGALVQVTGTVAEFVPASDPQQPPVTELTSPTTVQISTGNPLPAPIPLTATFPDPTGPFDQLERVEGMRVSVASFTATSGTTGSTPSDTTLAVTSFGEFFGVVTGVPRPFREAGIEAPDAAPSGSIPPIPRWDANPELLRVDSDGQIGVALTNLTTGAVITNLVGVLDYGFRRYSILPDAAITPAGGMALAAVSAPGPDDVTVASFNLRRFFNNAADTEVAPQPPVTEPVPNPAAWSTRLEKVSRAIRDSLRNPDIIGVQEVENEATLDAIAAQVSADAIANAQADPLYEGYVMPGNDVGGINVGFLVKQAPVAGATPRVTVNAIVQEGQATTWIDPKDNLSHLLNDRPPLRLDGVVNFADGRTFPLQVIVVHQRSLNGIDDESPDGLTTVGDRVRKKRHAQAEWLAGLIQARQAADPGERLVVLGDFNAFEVNDGFVDVMGTVLGTPAPDAETVVPGDGTDLVNPDLTRLLDVAPAQRYSYVHEGNAQTLDHVLVGDGLLARVAAAWAEHARINADFEHVAADDAGTAKRTSDHDPVVAYLTSDLDGDGNADSSDPCNDLLPPSFTVLAQDLTAMSGTVDDCSGVAAVVLAPGSSNLQLTLGGNPGDASRPWAVTMVNPFEPASGALAATDSSAGAEQAELAIAFQELEPVPLAGSAGLALLALAIALGGAILASRRSPLA